MADDDRAGFRLTVVASRLERPYPRVYYPRCIVGLEVLLRESPGRDDTFHSFELIPRSAELSGNSFLEADTFSAEFDYRDFPLDPRAIKSVRVNVYMGDVGAPDRDLPIDKARTLRLIGFVDEPETTLGEDGETVRFEGRDVSGILLDFIWQDGAFRIDRPMKAVITGILQAVPGCEKLPIDLGPLHGKIASKVTGRSLYSPENGDDAWTVISQLVGLFGFVPVMELDTLRVRTPAEIGQHVVQLDYGSNVQRIRFVRKLTERKVVQVEVRAYDPVKNTVRSVLHPVKPLIVGKRVSAEGKVTADYAPKLPFFVEGAYTDEELRTLAKSIYDKGAFADTEGTITTREMTDLFGEDLVALRNGDQVVVRLAKKDRTSLSGLSDEQAIEQLTSGPDPLDDEVADAILAAWRRSEDLESRFYVTKTRHTWDREQGYELEVEFANYAGGVAP